MSTKTITARPMSVGQLAKDLNRYVMAKPDPVVQWSIPCWTKYDNWTIEATRLGDQISYRCYSFANFWEMLSFVQSAF